MKKVLIVDDETIVRFTLRSMIDWERFGFEVAADCINAMQALEYIGRNEVDLLITDVKMPNMSGIELLRRLADSGMMPVTLVLSGYNEFEMVREAFRLGAYDYVLKSDLNVENLKRILRSLSENVLKEEHSGTEREKQFPIGISGGTEELDRESAYCVVLFEVDNFVRQAARFGENLKEKMEKPMVELCRQIPRIAARGKVIAVNPARYILYLRVTDKEQYQSGILSVVKQLQAVWHDYMNLDVSAGVSLPTDFADVEKALQQCELLLRIGAVTGKGSITAEWEDGKRAEMSEVLKEKKERLIKALYFADEMQMEREKKKLFDEWNTMEEHEVKEELLIIIALVAMKFREYDDDFYSLFPETVDYGTKIKRLEGVRELELWANNFFSWIKEYIMNRKNQKQVDIMLRAKRFIADNYANPEITLGSVADYIGLNEKYFSSRFTKETGSNFSAFLTEIRLQKAKNLMNTTDLKMYEISERVGYNSVEHFNRMFKREFGISPGDYKRKNI